MSLDDPLLISSLQSLTTIASISITTYLNQNDKRVKLHGFICSKLLTDSAPELIDAKLKGIECLSAYLLSWGSDAKYMSHPAEGEDALFLPRHLLGFLVKIVKLQVSHHPHYIVTSCIALCREYLLISCVLALHCVLSGWYSWCRKVAKYE